VRDPALPLCEQSSFAELAAFMDALVAEGVVALGRWYAGVALRTAPTGRTPPNLLTD
jgi:hypothetical protein